MDKGSASAVCDLKTLISPIDWQINIALCKTIPLAIWWIVLSGAGIGHFSFKQGTRAPRITKRSKERSKVPREMQSLLQVEGMAMEGTKVLRKGPEQTSDVWGSCWPWGDKWGGGEDTKIALRRRGDLQRCPDKPRGVQSSLQRQQCAEVIL